MSDLASLLSADLLDAIDRRIEEHVAEAVAVAVQAQAPVPAWLSIEQAASYAGSVSARTIERLISRGDLRATSLGRRRLVRRADLDALLEARADVKAATGGREKRQAVPVRSPLGKPSATGKEG